MPPLVMRASYGLPLAVAPPRLLLTDEELVQLKRVAQLRVRLLPGLDWRDLLHEALVRVAEGRRSAPPHVSTVMLVAQTMRSLAADIRRRDRLSRVYPDDGTGKGTAQEVADLRPDPEQIAIYRDALARIEAGFAKDPDALRYVTLLALGMAGVEAARQMGLDAAGYETVRKRVRRALLRHLAEGESWCPTATTQPRDSSA